MTRFMIAPLLLALVLSGCSRNSDAAHEDHTGHAAEGEAGAATHADEAQTGTHGGRLLSQDGDSVELAIAEDGTPPTYQAWLYRDGKPLPATAGNVEVHLQRLGGANESPLKNPQTTYIARLHLRYRCAGIASFRYATSWFLAVFAHAYTPSCRRAVACR